MYSRPGTLLEHAATIEYAEWMFFIFWLHFPYGVRGKGVLCIQVPARCQNMLAQIRGAAVLYILAQGRTRKGRSAYSSSGSLPEHAATITLIRRIAIQLRAGWLFSIFWLLFICSSIMAYKEWPVCVFKFRRAARTCRNPNLNTQNWHLTHPVSLHGPLVPH